MHPDDRFIEEVRSYIAGTLHHRVDFDRWPGGDRLPVFLSKRYGLYAGHIGSRACRVAVDQTGGETTPTEIAKHIKQIDTNEPVIYAAPWLTADRRKRLILAGVAFVIPGNQLYLPQFALDLREHFRARPKRNLEQLTPAAQAVLFQHLLRPDKPASSPTQLAAALGYSAMSIGRAFTELSRFDLAQVRKRGRGKKIFFTENAEQLLEIARPYLRSPVRGRQLLATASGVDHLPLAGESALAELTDLSPPSTPSYAIHDPMWPTVATTANLNTVHHLEEASVIIELWRYKPSLFTDNHVVDPLSLYAEYWDHTDERVAKAAESLLDALQWS